MRYTDALGLRAGDVVSIVGSGGKTSLLWRLAQENRDRAVLVSTTTKMWYPDVGLFDWDVSGMFPRRGDDTCRGAHCASAGSDSACTINYAGKATVHGRAVRAPTGISLLYGSLIDGKIAAPTMERLAAASAEAFLTLIECDGARELPLKGWAAHEPVVPGFATVTIGMLPLWAIGQTVCAETVHRMPAFCRITGAQPGEIVTAAHLVRVVCRPDGLFAKARGRRALFLNAKTAENLVGARIARPRAGTRTDVHCAPLRDAQEVAACLEAPMTVLVGDIHRGTVEVIRWA